MVKDVRLQAGFALHGNSWKDVAAYVGCDKNPSQCHKRYTWYVNPALADRNKDPWTDEEVRRASLRGECIVLIVQFVTRSVQVSVLRSLVEHHGLKQTGRGLKESINWTLISRELNRDYYDCKNKHKLLLSADMKKGPFTAEEDAIIADRVIAWGNRGNGLWVAIVIEGKFFMVDAQQVKQQRCK